MNPIQETDVVNNGNDLMVRSRGLLELTDGNKASFVDKFREGSYLQITQDDPLRNKVFRTSWSILENAVYDGIPELLEQLREHGYVLAVATSKPEVYTLRILEHFDLSRYFTAVAGCDIHRAGETKADMIRLALRRLGLPEQEPPQTVMIGDRKHDVLGAKECRVPCIGVRYGYAEAGELEQYGADWVTDSVETLGKLLL